MQRAPQEPKRKFDWELARDMRNDGCSWADLGRFFAVSPPAVMQAVYMVEYAETGVWHGSPSLDPRNPRKRPTAQTSGHRR